VELMAKHQYNDSAIQQSSPFLSIDLEVNSALAASDVSLAAMAKVLQLHSSVRECMRGWMV
jgi:hypothetical protein